MASAYSTRFGGEFAFTWHSRMVSGTEGFPCQAIWAFPFSCLQKWPFAFAGLPGMHGAVLTLFPLASRAFLPVCFQIGFFHEVVCLGRESVLKH